MASSWPNRHPPWVATEPSEHFHWTCIILIVTTAHELQVYFIDRSSGADGPEYRLGDEIHAGLWLASFA